MFSSHQKSKRPHGAVRTSATQHTASWHISKRWLLLFMSLGLLTAAVWYMQVSWQPKDIPLGEVSINGEIQYLSQQQLQKTISDNLVGGYFTIDLEQIRDALLTLPWMQEVSIRRVWPSGLNIAIEEKTAIAYWGENALLSDRGQVFIPALRPTQLNLPVLSGPDGLHHTVWQFLTMLQSQFTPLGLQIQKLVLDKRRAWQLQLANGTIVKLGRSDTERRIRRFNHVFAMHNAPKINEIEIIDMRYPNGFALLTKTNNKDDETTARVTTRVSEV